MLSGYFRNAMYFLRIIAEPDYTEIFSFLSGKPEWKKFPLLRVELSVRFGAGN
jgi:hypothetical protein